MINATQAYLSKSVKLLIKKIDYQFIIFEKSCPRFEKIRPPVLRASGINH